LMNHLADPSHKQAATRIRELLSTYLKSEDLIQIGAYKKGSSKEVDEAIDYYPNIISYLKQDVMEKRSFKESVEELIQLAETGE